MGTVGSGVDSPVSHVLSETTHFALGVCPCFKKRPGRVQLDGFDSRKIHAMHSFPFIWKPILLLKYLGNTSGDVEAGIQYSLRTH